jgi:hypothetical protein
MNFFVRAEFVNIFNRTIMPAPSTTNPQIPVSKNGLGINTSGFGVISAYASPGTVPAAPPYLSPRTGTLVARFTF